MSSGLMEFLRTVVKVIPLIDLVVRSGCASKTAQYYEHRLCVSTG